MFFTELWQRSIRVNKLIITADSTFDLPPVAASALGIEVIPAYVRTDGEDMPDYPGVTMRELFAFHDRTGKLPQTAAAAPWEYEAFFRRFEGEGVELLHIAKSAGMSSCCDNARLAAQSLPFVTVFDSQSVGSGSAMIAAEASRLRAQGLGAADMIAPLERYRGRIVGSFIVEELEYLHKGGRCSSLAHFGANLLRLRPQIVFHDGLMTVGKKYRGRFDACALELMDDMLKTPHETDRAYVSHTVVDEERLNGFVRYLKKKGGFREIAVLPAGSAVSCHCGPNTFGVFLVRPE